MSTLSVTKVLIRTLPLKNGNYGGILQAFALQRVLLDLGATPVTDVSESHDRPDPLAGIKIAVKEGAMALGYSRPAWFRDAVRRGADGELRRFVSQRINTVRLYRSARRPDPTVLEEIDAFLVGSDQVWRRGYGDVRSYLLDFIPDDDLRPRASYAASFGHDHIDDYDSELMVDSTRLAHRLDTVSIREASGITLAAQSWGVAAVHHLDPTMLLSPDIYTEIASTATDGPARGRLIDYVLDNDSSTRRTVRSLSSVLGEDAVSLLPAQPQTYRDYRVRPARYRKLSIEGWLGAISGARFVVTDSFHGTVFAILHNVPFVAIANGGRGASRFESLLDSVELRERLVPAGAEVTSALVTKPIDWSAVNARLANEQNRARDYLRDFISRADKGSR